MQQSEEAATETKSERRGCLRFVAQRSIIKLQLLQRLTQIVIILRLNRVQTAEYHRINPR